MSTKGDSWERLYVAVKTVVVIMGSLLGLYVAPFPDLLKGLLLGALTVIYIALIVHFWSIYISDQYNSLSTSVRLTNKTKHMKDDN